MFNNWCLTYLTCIGDFSPNGCKSSILVLPRLTKTVVTPCSGKSSGGLTSAPRISLTEIEIESANFQGNFYNSIIVRAIKIPIHSSSIFQICRCYCNVI